MKLKVMLNKFLIFVIFYSLINVNIIYCKSSDENIVSVRIKNGLIKGKLETSVDGKQLNVFRGIPYAEPPVGPLRFRKPLPLKEWPQVINAFEMSNICHQNLEIDFMAKMFGNQTQSEDCLYLNIWTPSDSIRNSELKPVIFYIHGGALLWGSGSWDSITGEVLAAKGDVVLVNINYRLSTLGFLYYGNEDAPGNVGLWDQSLALEWVSDNIQYFGGDSNRITIMGMSAGSWSASLHVLSPITRNLYENAVLQSGAYTDNMIGGTPQQHIQKWLKASQIVGCNEDKSDKFDQKIIDCLRAVEPNTLVKITEMSEIKTEKFIFFPLVVIDGQFLPKKPSEMLSSGDFKQKLNLMISTAVDEGTVIMLFDEMPKFNLNNPVNLTLSESITRLTEISSQMNNEFKIDGKEVSKLYFSGLSDNNDYSLYRRTAGKALGDYYLLCPTLLFGKEVFKNSGFKSNVYQYYYNVPSPFHGSDSSHGDDMGISHGIPFLNKDLEFLKPVSQQMIQFITDFAKNGEPTPQSGTNWPKYYNINDNIISPFYEITKEPKSDTNFGIGLKITECEYLWKKYLLR